jgi:outer membrane murein-binding lipoprotein Lpp
MKTLACLLTFIVLTTAVIAQDARIPQDIPLQRPTKTLDNDPLLKSLRSTSRQAPATGSTANAVSVEDRIAALEAKVAALESEVQAQKDIINELQQRLDQQQQQKKN